MYGDLNEPPFLEDCVLDYLFPLDVLQPYDNKIVVVLVEWKELECYDDIETCTNYPSLPIETSIFMTPNLDLQGPSSSSVIQHLEVKDYINPTLAHSFDVHT